MAFEVIWDPKSLKVLDKLQSFVSKLVNQFILFMSLNQQFFPLQFLKVKLHPLMGKIRLVKQMSGNNSTPFILNSFKHIVHYVNLCAFHLLNKILSRATSKTKYASPCVA